MAVSCDVPRPNSCSSTPCKIVKGFAQRLVHATGLLGRQDLLPPGLQLPGRNAAGISRDIERPAEMLSRMTQPNAQAVVTADFVIERADVTELLGQCGRGFGCATFKAPADLAREPGRPLRATSDHHGI